MLQIGAWAHACLCKSLTNRLWLRAVNKTCCFSILNGICAQLNPHILSVCVCVCVCVCVGVCYFLESASMLILVVFLCVCIYAFYVCMCVCVCVCVCVRSGEHTCALHSHLTRV